VEKSAFRPESRFFSWKGTFPASIPSIMIQVRAVREHVWYLSGLFPTADHTHMFDTRGREKVTAVQSVQTSERLRECEAVVFASAPQ
jgi:hypothetical protein